MLASWLNCILKEDEGRDVPESNLRKRGQIGRQYVNLQKEIEKTVYDFYFFKYSIYNWLTLIFTSH